MLGAANQIPPGLKVWFEKKWLLVFQAIDQLQA
jgi:hypothetical protein